MRQTSEKEYEDEENAHNILSVIIAGMYDSLIAMNINQNGKTSYELINRSNLSNVTLSRYSEFEQFKEGVCSSYPGFCNQENYEALQ